MADDLLILKILKIPVIVIGFLSNTFAIFTYIPNYFIILGLDMILFNASMYKTLTVYAISWIPRLICLLSALLIFLLQFYGIYAGLQLYQNHWALQIVVMILSVSGLLFLMRKGYLSMIKRFNPTKLKSPYEHFCLIYDFLYDILCLFLTLINVIMIARTLSTLSYEYKADRHNYLKHILKQIHESILVYIKFFYVKIFFKVFPWRYKHSLPTIEKQNNHILNLFVLLTILFASTLVDIIFLFTFGLYCTIHPKRKIFFQKLQKTHEKWKPVKNFIFGSIIENTELIILLFCFPFKYHQTKQLMKKIISSKTYDKDYLPETFKIVKLACIKIPSLFCLLFLFISVYKYKRFKLLKNKQNAQPQEYISFKCFFSLLFDLLHWVLVLIVTPIKPWNIGWLKIVINNQYNLDKELIEQYWKKTINDFIAFVPSIIITIIVFSYDPINTFKNFKKLIHFRNSLKFKRKFYKQQNSIVGNILVEFGQKMLKDILYLPFYFLLRLSMLSIFKCISPQDSAPLFEHLYRLFYISRVIKKGKIQHFSKVYKEDESAGLIITEKQKLIFWKFAYKICKIKIYCKVIGSLMPSKMRNRIYEKSIKQNRFSSISNEYWTNYNILNDLLKGFAFFVIELVVTLVGVLILLPFTLWRFPTFIILFKKHEYSKKQFFPILFKMYKRMLNDILQLPLRIIALLIFPRHFCIFYFKTIFRYGKNFENVEKLKYQYIKRILSQGFTFIFTLWQISFIKFLWVRKLQFNNKTQIQEIKVRHFVKELFKHGSIPDIEDLVEKGVGQLTTTEKNERLKQITDDAFQNTLKDLPYLLLMLFLVITLPWRIFYIKKALFMMRENTENRRQFIKLLKNIIKDYQCILLYFLLLISGIKTKRSIQLFVRNAKINFYVGLLRYSTSKELRKQLKQAGIFYRDILLIAVAFIISPYRAWQLKQAVVKVYTKHKRDKKIQKQNEQIYLNTIKQKKEVKLLTKMGYQCFLTTCSYLTTPQLVRLTRVNHFTYDMIKQRDQVWFQHWNRVYAEKNPHIQTQNYNELCVQFYRNENKHVKKQITYFHEVALEELQKSRASTLDLKQFLRDKISPEMHRKIFTTLHYNIRDGFGPQENWPQPQDNPEFLQLMMIERRPVQQLQEQMAFAHFLGINPVQFFIIRLTRLYTTDTHRKPKQLLYLFIKYGGHLLYALSIYLLWDLIWEITCYIGIKILFIIYVHLLLILFRNRFLEMSNGTWVVVLRPFNLIQDFIIAIKRFFRFFKRKAVETKNWLKMKIVLPIQRFFQYMKLKARQGGNWTKRKVFEPIKKGLKWLWNKIASFFKYIWNKVKYVFNIFVQKVAKPLYIKVSNTLRTLWRLLKQTAESLASAMVTIFKKLGNLIKQLYKLFINFFKNLNLAYESILKATLKFSLKFGMIGELIFTVMGIAFMVLPSIIYYYWYSQRWYLILSTIMTMIMMVMGYKHLRKAKRQI